MKLTIVSGRSGSGKSVCLHALEDLGFYCIDNLPVGLLPTLVAHINAHPQIAVSIDARNLPADLDRFAGIIDELKKTILQHEIIFLDAADHILIKRFSETRRKHPLSSEKISLKEAVQNEAQLLGPINELADLRIDTSFLNVQQLRELVRNRISPKTHAGLSLLFQSFGYKYGVPLDADFVFDVRCLPNPYWELNLRNCSGVAPEVKEYLQQQTFTKELLTDIQKFLQTWLPRFANDNRNYMTVAIGCTGGQHRSVYIAEELANYFRNYYENIQIRHREL